MRLKLPLFVIASLLGWVSPLAHAQTPANVAVVINDNSAVSQLIGNHYVEQRGIPSANVLHIETVTDETIDRATYVNTIERPLGAAIARGRLQDKILFIVLTKGVPLRIAGSGGTDGTASSVDSELTLLYRRMTGRAAGAIGRVENPYFLGGREVAAARKFTHRDHDIYLVTRLDGFTADEAMALVDLARAPSSAGRIVLDQRAALTNRGGDDWLAAAARRLEAAGQGARVLLETTPQRAASPDPVLGYASWGATDPQLRARRSGLRFAPGALALTFGGADARTFLSPPDTWAPMSAPSNARSWFGGSPQSLVGDLVRDGVTGVAGNVAEPFLEGTARPDLVFPAYVSGFTLGEAFYLAIPYLSWQTVVIGDPLCAPFPGPAVPREDLDPGIERTTELPRYFSRRRLDVFRASVSVEPAVAERLVLAEARIARGDTAAGRLALTEAAAAAPTLVGPYLQLALLDEADANHDGAIAHYRRVLELQPDNAVVLNNLAYALAVHKNAPRDAKPLAERAVILSKRAGTIVDTLAWIEHLLGNEREAARLLDEAMKAVPGHAEIRLHAAIVAEALGQRPRASTLLAEALRRDSALADRDDVKALQLRLQP